MVMSDGAIRVRQFRLSSEVLRFGIGLALMLLAVLGSAAAGFLVAAGASRADGRLVAKNQLLERELGVMMVRLDTMESSLQQLSGKDEFYRLVAGLDALDSDVLLAGIGGPDGEDLELSELYRVDPQTGRQLFGATTQLNAMIRRASLLAASWSEAETALNQRHARLRATPSILPTRGRISSSFSTSRWHPILNRPRPHNGIDIVAPAGTPVVASASGRVTNAGSKGDYGLLVEIDHGQGVVTRYAHLSRTAVRVGQKVERGDAIGTVGTSGMSVGPHLHYEVLVNGRHSDPRNFILDTELVTR
jgi:murein DD-endopeptidase MepM/ murein hydrolase activator NlpD